MTMHIRADKAPQQEKTSCGGKIFFHPDCTVGFGVSPNHALRLVGCTTGRELHPALKILLFFLRIIIAQLPRGVKTEKRIDEPGRKW